MLGAKIETFINGSGQTGGSENLVDDEKEAQVLAYIRAYQQAYPGLSPSYRAIAEAVELKSISTVFYHLAHLEEQGKIEKNPSGRQGVVLRDTAVITQEDAELLGLDWNKLLVLKYATRKALKGRDNGG